jgi:hypothetical protein
MCDVARMRFAEYMVGDCMADQTAQVTASVLTLFAKSAQPISPWMGTASGDFEVVYGMEERLSTDRRYVNRYSVWLAHVLEGRIEDFIFTSHAKWRRLSLGPRTGS